MFKICGTRQQLRRLFGDDDPDPDPTVVVDSPGFMHMSPKRRCERPEPVQFAVMVETSFCQVGGYKKKNSDASRPRGLYKGRFMGAKKMETQAQKIRTPRPPAHFEHLPRISGWQHQPHLGARTQDGT